MGCGDNSHVCRRYMWVAMQIFTYLGHTRVLYIASRLQYAGFLKETHVYIKKDHFKATSWNFQTLVSSRNF